MKLIDKDALIADIEKEIKSIYAGREYVGIPTDEVNIVRGLAKAEDIANYSFEVKDPYKQCVQYDSIKAGIQSHAETYSFNIESELFNQLSPEQQKLWRKEIEQACISGGDAGVGLARDTRYKENLEVKEVDLEKFTEKINTFQARYKRPEITSIKGAMAFMARMFYQYPNVAREWYESLPKATMG